LDEQTGAATMHDYDDQWDRSEIVDLDVTGDPQLDQQCYQSPRRDMGPPPAEPFDWLAQHEANQAQIEADNARRQAERERRRAAVRDNLDETRRRIAERHGGPAMLPPQPASMLPPQPASMLQPVQPVSQHGAYFEVRSVRVWWAPWRKRQVWTQVSAWRVGGPPKGVDVVTVPDVSVLPGTVTTIGTVSETGAVEW
jgi:hypothetical protein